MSFMADCFSGECGLCFNCVNTTEMVFNRKSFCKEKLIPEDLQRAKDLSKIIGKNYREEIKERKTKDLLKWCKKYGYKDPFCYGYAPEKITDLKYKFKIVEEKHNLLCDNIYCKMVYEISSDWEKKTRYPIMPMYKPEGLNLCGPNLCGPNLCGPNLCGPCIKI